MIYSEENYNRLRGHAGVDGLKVSEWIARESFKQADALLSAARADAPERGA